ncbi:hypothetical protein ACHQM5_005646 [Ranunculus cassubicifolius]
MASSLISSSSPFAIIRRPKLRVQHHQVRAQALGDEVNLVDANMEALNERIDNIKTREKLQRCYTRAQQGWCYSPVYDETLKKKTRSLESLDLMVMACKTFGLTVSMSSLLLYILSLAVHSQLLGH